MGKKDDKLAKLKELFEQNHRTIYRFMLRQVGGNRQEAADLTQETFLCAMQSWDSLEDQHKARAWLFAIAKNKSIDFIRNKYRQNNGLSQLREQARPGCGFESPYEQYCRKERRAVLTEVFEQIRDDQIRKTAQLYYSQNGYSFADVAGMLGVSRNTVSTRIGRVARMVKRKLLKRAQGLIE